MDISNLGQPLLQSGLFDSISRFVGGNSETTKKTLDAALPSTMYAIADHGSSEIGARGLLDGLKSGQAPQLDVASLGRVLGDPQASDRLMATSGGFLEKLLGGKLAGLIGGLSSFGGVDRSMSSKLLALAAPLALGVIGKRAQSEHLDARGLAGFLGEQKGRVASLIPGPLRAYVGLAPPAPVPIKGEPVRAQAPSAVRHEAAAGANVRPLPVAPAHHRALWPWFLIGLAALVGLGLLFGRAFRTPHPRVAAPAVTEPAPTVPTPTVPKAEPPKAEAPASAERQAPAANEPAATAPAATAPAAQAPTSTEGPLKPIADYLSSDATAPRRFVLEDMTFDTGSSTLTAEGQKSVDDLAVILRAHPDATVKIEGFTDATGGTGANRRLSESRAEDVGRALAGEGIDSSRIQTAGRGEIKQLGTNEASRRVEVLISPRG